MEFIVILKSQQQFTMREPIVLADGKFVTKNPMVMVCKSDDVLAIVTPAFFQAMQNQEAELKRLTDLQA